MKFPTYVKVLLVMLVAAVGVVLSTYRPERETAFAQAERPMATLQPTGLADTEVDPYDRNAMLWASLRSGYRSGWQRGQEIYYMRCWMCHSEYIIAGDHKPAPSLRDIARRMTDQQITMFVRAGTPGMPAYSPEELTDADMKDLLALFREKCGTFPAGGGGFDEHNPPANPNYRFQKDVSTTH